MLASLSAGFRSLRRNPGLVLLVLGTNLLLALVLAVPLAGVLEESLARTGASRRMAEGFDYDWWSAFDARATGPASAVAPDLLGHGFALRNLDLLLRGTVPAGLFDRASAPDSAILGAAALYVLLQLFLTGGILGVFRAPAGGWTFRGLVHGSGFYFGRMVRVSLIALALAGLLFAAHAPLARSGDRLAAEAVSERTALALAFGRQALLFLALVALHMVSSHAKVLVVREERLSAIGAFLSSAAFCLRRLPAAAGQYAVVGLAGGLLLAALAFCDARLAPGGFPAQAAALVLFEAFVAGRIALRLFLLASQLELQEGGRA